MIADSMQSGGVGGLLHSIPMITGHKEFLDPSKKTHYKSPPRAWFANISEHCKAARVCSAGCLRNISWGGNEETDLLPHPVTAILVRTVTLKGPKVSPQTRPKLLCTIHLVKKTFFFTRPFVSLTPDFSFQFKLMPCWTFHVWKVESALA